MPPIPEHSPWGVLPPFLDAADMSPGRRSPYHASIDEIVERFGYSGHRRYILNGFLQYRSALRECGLIDAFQWVDGGFLDKKEEEPRDIDVVTLYRVPAGWTPTTMGELLRERPDLFNPMGARAKYHVDAYFLDLDMHPRSELVRWLTYWFSLFSHQRVTRAWRGLVQTPLLTVDGDASAKEILERVDP